MVLPTGIRATGPLVVALLALAGGCRRAPSSGTAAAVDVTPSPPVRVLSLSLSGGAIGALPDGESPAAPSQDELRAAASAGLQRAGVVLAEGVGPQRPRGDYRLKLELGLTTVPPEGGTRGLLRAAVRGRLVREHPAGAPAAPETDDTSDDMERIDQEVLAERAVDAKELSAAALRAHGQRAVTDTAATLGAQLKLQEADAGRLVALLTGEADRDLRGMAIRLCGLRRIRAAVPHLAALLRDQDPETRDKAIGALVTIGDPSAVKPMASSAQFSDTAELGKILEAVAHLGGDEARSYLNFVAAGHQSEQIRKEAQVALGHLEQREQRERQRADRR